MKLELISFKICPFAQRAVITLLRDAIPHSVTYIDIASPPDWLTQLSPYGKVPVLKVDDRHVIFDSAIIDEYLNDLCSTKLLPADPLQRALDRCWIDVGTTLLEDFSGLIHATDAERYASKLQAIKHNIDWLEHRLGQGPWFNADQFSLVDIAYAPLFMRTRLLQLDETLYPVARSPKVAAWAEQLLTIPELSRSVVSDFEDVFKAHIRLKAPYAAIQFNL